VIIIVSDLQQTFALYGLVECNRQGGTYRGFFIFKII
jgi:hypothetical protein